jgi:hypothetical protein
MSDDNFVGLAEAIHNIRGEIIRAQELGAGSSLKFEVEPVELTMNLVVSSTGKVGVKVGFGPIGAEAGADVGSSTTHTITLRMLPQNTGAGEESKSVLIASESTEEDPFERRRARRSSER